MHKGQAVSLDLFFAIVIMFLIFLAFVAQNNLNINYSTEEITEKEMKRMVSGTTDNLVLSRGFPENWETGTGAEIIGLVNYRRIIDKEKLEEFLDMDYDDSVRQLGIGGYDYYFALKQDGFVVKEKYNTADSGYLSTAEKIAGTKRMVEYNGEISELHFKLYR